VGSCSLPSVCIRDAKEAFSVRPRFPENFQYMVLDVEDNEEQNLIRLFPSCVTFSIFFVLL
jgi:serine/threonine/tyrosine-interacting protein